MEVGNGAPPTVAEKEQERKSQEKIKQEAYDFDPDASPEDKAAQMKKVMLSFAARDHRQGCSCYCGQKTTWVISTQLW